MLQQEEVSSNFCVLISKRSVHLQVRSSQYGGTLRALNGYPSIPGPALVDAVDHALRRVCYYLVEGEACSLYICSLFIEMPWQI